jgi:hypothetical protein
MFCFLPKRCTFAGFLMCHIAFLSVPSLVYSQRMLLRTNDRVHQVAFASDDKSIFVLTDREFFAVDADGTKKTTYSEFWLSANFADLARLRPAEAIQGPQAEVLEVDHAERTPEQGP